MGYYTDYDFSDLTDEQLQTVNEVSEYNFSHSYNDSCKWYSWHEHMIEVSKRFPDDLLVISGDGEEQGDQWKAYFKNGKSQVCKAVITFEEFDESKLK